MNKKLHAICIDLASQGKTPSIAMLRAKTKSAFHISELIAAVQYWKSSPEPFDPEETADCPDNSSSIGSMERTALELKVDMLERKVAKLEAQLIAIDNDRGKS